MNSPLTLLDNSRLWWQPARILGRMAVCFLILWGLINSLATSAQAYPLDQQHKECLTPFYWKSGWHPTANSHSAGNPIKKWLAPNSPNRLVLELWLAPIGEEEMDQGAVQYRLTQTLVDTQPSDDGWRRTSRGWEYLPQSLSDSASQLAPTVEPMANLPEVSATTTESAAASSAGLTEHHWVAPKKQISAHSGLRLNDVRVWLAPSRHWSLAQFWPAAWAMGLWLLVCSFPAVKRHPRPTQTPVRSSLAQTVTHVRDESNPGQCLPGRAASIRPAH